MSQFTTQQFYQPPPTNSLGIAGFIVSLSGLIVCFGLTCPIGLGISLIALLSAPRGYAIAGVIIGMLGSIMGTALALMYFGVIGQGWFFSPHFSSQSQTFYTMQIASSDIDNHHINNNTLPDAATGTSLISSHIDEWGNAMEYLPTPNQGHDYEITSAGPDGQFGTGDDYTEIFWINTWNPQPNVTQPPQIGGATEEQIEAAFEQAAKKITESFPPDSQLPDSAAVDSQAGVLMDAWQMPMKFSPTSNPPFYHLKSAGPDGQWDTEDDLTRSFYFAPTGETEGPF